jgi:MtN3 and saliva related transmembrane protein
MLDNASPGAVLAVHPASSSFSMSISTLIGLFAAFCTTAAFVPQVLRTWKTRSTEDISLGMFVFYSTGIFSWLVYGVIIRDVPLMASNGVTFVLSLIMLGFKLRYG